MFSPATFDSIIDWNDVDLEGLPTAEDDLHEFKSSAIKDSELAAELGKGASAFWNSGGGVMIVGVDGTGRPDSGITTTVGRQDRRDWIDLAVAKVSPSGRYAVRAIGVDDGKAVFIVGFGASESAPHMAPDHRYYIRAGAHSVPANHFLVEAIHARRGVRKPLLRPVVRRSRDRPGIIEMGVLALNDAPALDVRIHVDPLPKMIQYAADRFPIEVPVISYDVPYFFDFTAMTNQPDDPKNQVILIYWDLAGNEYQEVSLIDVVRQLGPGFSSPNKLRDIENALKDISQAIKHHK